MLCPTPSEANPEEEKYFLIRKGDSGLETGFFLTRNITDILIRNVVDFGANYNDVGFSVTFLRVRMSMLLLHKTILLQKLLLVTTA